MVHFPVFAQGTHLCVPKGSMIAAVRWMVFGGTYDWRFTIYPTDFETIRGAERINPFPTKRINIFPFNALAQKRYRGGMHKCIPYESFFNKSIMKLHKNRLPKVGAGICFLLVLYQILVKSSQRFPRMICVKQGGGCSLADAKQRRQRSFTQIRPERL